MNGIEIHARIAWLEGMALRLERFCHTRESHLATIDWSAMTVDQVQHKNTADEEMGFMLADIYLELVHLYDLLSINWHWEIEA